MRNDSPFQSEPEFVEWLRRQTSTSAKGVRLGIGDDAAIVSVRPGHELILTTDMSIDGVHFKAGIHPPASIGHRALARSLSDVAAMGGLARYVLISAALSKGQTQAWLLEVYRGLFKLARRFGVQVVGGDTSMTSGPTTLDVIVTGEVPRRRALLRSGAKRGDLIYVSGKLGMSALGLSNLLSGSAMTDGREENAASRVHLFPEPQDALGRFLSTRGLATAAMDLSDGLSIDLKRLCDASGTGARLFADKIPTPNLPDKTSALELALHGGEDYQLLFTVSPRKARKIPAKYGKTALHCVGVMEARKGITLVDASGKLRPLRALGWDHFARNLDREASRKNRA
jgi:thiamine-monophosphate kinase